MGQTITQPLGGEPGAPRGQAPWGPIAAVGWWMSERGDPAEKGDPGGDGGGAAPPPQAEGAGGLEPRRLELEPLVPVLVLRPMVRMRRRWLDKGGTPVGYLVLIGIARFRNQERLEDFRVGERDTKYETRGVSHGFIKLRSHCGD